MGVSTFKTNPYHLESLLNDCHEGKLQLPDFQRSWVWDEDRIRSLLASMSRAFPVGALMTLDTGGIVDFKPRPIQGAPSKAWDVSPQSLLLDGQQRMTSLYQVSMRNQVVETVTPKKKKVKRWFYIDIAAALDESRDREEAIISVPEDKKLKSNFGKTVDLDLSTREGEYTSLMFPVSMLFRWTEWQKGFINYAIPLGELESKWAILDEFHSKVVENFDDYQLPVIALGSTTSKEAVCVVFEKVNTGGKPLDAFELVTAMYAADGHELRKDWYGDEFHKGRHRRFAETYIAPGDEAGILNNVANTDFLHVISLFYTREMRREAERQGKSGRDLPQVTGKRQALLNLPVGAYKKHQERAEEGFLRAAKFLFNLHVFRIFDLPYQSQIIPLAAILADLGDDWDHGAYHQKLAQWYWNGVFGELYGSATETRIARDFMEVPPWLTQDGPPPSTISETVFRADRLKTMRMRLSAAYKGTNALLMLEGARDFQTGQKFDLTAFFGENTDIHHIFPRAWCNSQKIKPAIYDSIINKTPLGSHTNRTIGGAAPSEYLKRLVNGSPTSPAIPREMLDAYLASHLINPDLLWSNDFDAFLSDRQQRLVSMIEHAMGKKVVTDETDEDDEAIELDADAEEAEMTIAAD